MKPKLEEFEIEFWNAINKTSIGIYDTLKHIENFNMNRKDYALSSVDINSSIRSVIFTFFDKKEVLESDIKIEILNRIRKVTSTQTGIDKVRIFWDNLKWETYQSEVSNAQFF